jgi:hypothetical protein
VFNEVCCEAASVCEETVADGVAKLPSIINGYDSKDTLNGDETGLIFLAMPSDKC